MKLGGNPPHALEIHTDGHGLGDEVPDQMLHHEWMREQAMIERVGVGHDVRKP
jgi:hypothetical protein